MLARLKEKLWGREFAVRPTMEVTQSSASLEDPRQSLVEVSEESIHREQPLGNPRTEPLDVQMTRQHLRESQVAYNSQLSVIAEGQEVTESQFSSLEVGASEMQQTNSFLLASPSDPGAVPASSSSSFSSQQMILDAAQTAPSPTSPSVYSGDASSEPSPPSSSEQFRNTSGTLRYSETEEMARQMCANAWSQERNFESEAPHLEAEESNNQAETSSRTSPLITPECETEPQTLTSTEETAVTVITAAQSLERVSDSEAALIWAEESHQQEDTSSKALPSIAAKYEANPQPFTSTEESALPMMAAVGSQEMIPESEIAHIETGESDQQSNNFSGGSAKAYMPEPQPLMSTLPETSQAAMEKKAPGRATQLSRRRSTNKRSSSTNLTSTTTSAGTLSCLPSSSPTEVGPPTKHRRTSIAWHYFTKRSKFIATCNLCEEDVKTGKIGGCGVVGTSALLSHLRRKHEILREKVAASVVPGAVSEIRDAERPSTIERSSRTTSAASTSTTTSPVTLSCLPSSSPTEEMPPTKRHRQTSIAWQYFMKQSKFIATCNLCEEDVKTGKIGGCGVVGTAALLSHLRRKHEILQEKVAASVVPGAVSEIQDAERPSTIERASRTRSAASASTTTSPVTLSCLPSSSRTEERPPTKRHRQTSIAWQYFTKQSKFIATCNLCEEDVKSGKIGGCGVVGTAALFSHLKRRHKIPQEKVAPSVVPGATSKIQDGKRPSTIQRLSRTTSAASASTTTSPVMLSCLPTSSHSEVKPPIKCRRTSIAWQYFAKRFKFIATCRLCEEVVKIGKIGGCGVVGTAALFSHLKRKHKIPQEKVAPYVVPGAASKVQDAERPSTTERPSRTASAASTSTTTSPVTLNCLPSSPPTEVRPPTKRRQKTSIAGINFKKRPKSIATLGAWRSRDSQQSHRFLAPTHSRFVRKTNQSYPHKNHRLMMGHSKKGGKSDLQLNRGSGRSSPAHSNGADGMEEGDRYFHNMATPITLPEGTKPEDPVTASLLETTLQSTIQLMNKTLADNLAAYMKPLKDQLEEFKMTMTQASKKPESELCITLQEENRKTQRGIQLLQEKVIQLESLAKKAN